MNVGSPRAVHATCVLAGRRAVLIRGESGAGKSSLAHCLLSQDGARRPVRLVSDDLTLVTAAHGRLIAGAPPTVAGLLELRGIGIARAEHEPRAVVALVVDLVASEQVARIPEEAEMRTSLSGVVLPRLALPAGRMDAARCIFAALEALERGDALPLLATSDPAAPRIRA